MNRQLLILLTTTLLFTFLLTWATSAKTADPSVDAAQSTGEQTRHLWEKTEIVLHARTKFDNPYTDVVVWVDLEGPGFKKRCYGFWDGEDVFRVRVMATAPGTWNWKSGSKPADPGLAGMSGSFTAIDWTEAAEKGKSLPARNDPGNGQRPCL